MTPFAMTFMLVSMTAVTVLAGWCMYRILGGGPSGGPSEDESGGG
jgi:hypothetical protein